MILAGDIGGTKTNLALFELVGDSLKIVQQYQFASKDFSSFTDVISAFKHKFHMPRIDAACFGIAGAIIDGNCRTTNLPWEIKSADLREDLGIQKVRLLNDLEATAYGMLFLNKEEFVNLNPSAQKVKGNIAVIAAGTGLGEAMLFWDGEQYHPIGSEGGHTDFAPLTPQQDDLLVWLRKKYPEHVSYERILSGPGIAALYDFLKESNFAPEHPFMKQVPHAKDKSAMISECALEHNDSLCIEALRLFVEIYAAEAGNLALKTISLGGIYIGGGIAPKILPMMQKDLFLNTLVAKGRFEGMLRTIEVKLSLNAETALLGAARFAFDKL